MLSIEDWLFIGEYLRDRNGARAWRASRPDYKGNRASDLAWQCLQRPEIKEEVARTLSAMTADVGLTKDMVKKDIINVLKADTREFVNIQVGACRCCHGVGHQYQRTVREMERDRYDFETKPGNELLTFDTQGGIGFDAYADPHPECPECNGKGVDRIRLKDTRTLSEEAASLITGIKQGKHGIEITTRSKDAAREAAARLLGMNKDTLELSGSVKIEDMTDEQLAALVAKEMGK